MYYYIGSAGVILLLISLIATLVLLEKSRKFLVGKVVNQIGEKLTTIPEGNTSITKVVRWLEDRKSR